jgi:hypothetical protein
VAVDLDVVELRIVSTRRGDRGDSRTRKEEEREEDEDDDRIGRKGGCWGWGGESQRELR